MINTQEYIICRNKGKGLQKVMTVECGFDEAKAWAIKLCREIGAEVHIVGNCQGKTGFYILAVVSAPSYDILVYQEPILYSREDLFSDDDRKGGAE